MAALVTVTASGSNDLANAIRAAQSRARQLPATIAAATSDPARHAVLDSARADRGSLSISGIHARLDVKADVSGGEGHASLRLVATPRSAWGLASGAEPHLERAHKRALKLSAGRFYPAVQHPGTRHIDLWPAATRHARPAVKSAADVAAAANNPFRGG